MILNRVSVEPTRRNRRLTIILGLLMAGTALSPSQEKLWFTAYYPTWAMRPTGSPMGKDQYAIAPADINWSGITHVVHFFQHDNVNAAKPPYWSPLFDPKDSVEYLFNGITNPGRGSGTWLHWAENLISIAHRNGVKVLVDIHCVGGSAQWNAVTRDSMKTDMMMAGIVGWCIRHAYDGVELDVETWGQGSTPIVPTDMARALLILRKYLNTMNPRGVLIVAGSNFHAHAYPASVDTAVDHYDIQFYSNGNIWNPSIHHNSVSYIEPIYSPPLTGTCAGSTQMRAQGTLSSEISGPLGWVKAGHDRKKIGIGIAGFGYTYRGVNQLCVSSISDGNFGYSTYKQCRSLLANGGQLYWDDVAKVPYISGVATATVGFPRWWGVFGVNAGDPFFCTFENERSIQEKVNWIKEQGFGGVMLYDLTMDLDPLQAPGGKNLLHNALASALAAP